MWTRIMAVCALGAVLGACNDDPAGPIVEPGKTTYAFPPAVQNPPSFFGSPQQARGSRVEVYSKGVLKRVLVGDGSLSAQQLTMDLPSDFGDVINGLASNPVNKRTRHFTDLLQTVARTSPAARSKVIEAVSRQLLRETEHRDTTLADGSRVLEYYFDGQLASRVVLAAPPSAARPANSTDHSMPVGLTTQVPGETCTIGCEGTGGETYSGQYSGESDAELWATVVWIDDQIQSMVDTYETEGDQNGLYMITYQKKCIREVLEWSSAVTVTGLGIGKLAETWPDLTRIGKELGVFGGSVGLGSIVRSWINMHNCFHP